MNTDTLILTTAQIAQAKAFGVFIVESEDHRGDCYCARVVGVGDCFHIHSKTVLGCKRILLAALRQSGIDPKTIVIGVEGSCELVFGTLCDFCDMPATEGYTDSDGDHDLCDEHCD